jgi:MOB kinase activator 1
VLGSGNLQKAVVLPEGEDADEWIATHCVDFYNQASFYKSSFEIPN